MIAIPILIATQLLPAGAAQDCTSAAAGAVSAVVAKSAVSTIAGPVGLLMSARDAHKCSKASEFAEPGGWDPHAEEKAKAKAAAEAEAIKNRPVPFPGH